MSNAKTMIKALRALSRDIQSGDGVANACVADAANMIEELSAQLAKANERVKELESEKHKDSLETINDYILEFMEANDIENFSTNRLRTNEGRQIELTIRYTDGETPADLLHRANERIEELEAERQLLISEIEPLLDMQDGGEYYTRNSLADDIYEKFIGGNSSEVLNKFVLEKKIEVLDKLSAPLTYNRQYPEFCMKTRIDEEIEQLRKEQEK